jgi:hypothetical protein
MIRCGRVLVCLLIVTGCQSENWGPYSSPRVSGQVFGADTQKPLAGVNVIRGEPERHPHADSPPKGGELLMRKTPIHTNRKGEFVLKSERVLSIYRGTDWNQVRLRFVKAGYQTLQTNVALTVTSNTPEGEASLAIGRVFLQPARANEESAERNQE